MNWARKRMWTVISIFIVVILVVILVAAYAVIYKTPTCFDNKKNGSETGIDCGGSCTTVCSADAYPPQVTFARTLMQSGRQDLIAYIQNVNTSAYAQDARIQIDLFGQDGLTVHKTAQLSLPANTTVPLFIPGIATYPVQQVFVSFASGTPIWTKGVGWRMTPPKATNIRIGGSTESPRITATIVNQTAYVQQSVPFVASVFDGTGKIIAASQTVVVTIPSQGTTQATFTWNEPFDSIPARVEVLPVLALPSLVP